jgi:hypothetical protein
VVDVLAVGISASLWRHDPLDPWLVESGWDEQYWDGEAETIGRRVSTGMSPGEVRSILVDVLGELIGSPADGEVGLRE